MSVRIKDKDMGWAHALKVMTDTRLHVAAGVPASADEPKKDEDGKSRTTLLKVATIHELGTKPGVKPVIPRRSFIADTVDPRQRRYTKLAAKEAVNVLTGRGTQYGVLNRVGLVMVGDMKRRISLGIGPALKPATIRRKGSSKPLIDTGQLRNSITHEVRGGA